MSMGSIDVFYCINTGNHYFKDPAKEKRRLFGSLGSFYNYNCIFSLVVYYALFYSYMKTCLKQSRSGIFMENKIWRLWGPIIWGVILTLPIMLLYLTIDFEHNIAVRQIVIYPVAYLMPNTVFKAMYMWCQFPLYGAIIGLGRYRGRTLWYSASLIIFHLGFMVIGFGVGPVRQ